jgi:hypothetical protein
MNEATNIPIHGAKYLQSLRALLKPLKAHAEHGNRQLHYDDYAVFLLMGFLQPIDATLRWLETASRLKSVQKRLGVKPTSIASLSDASRVFDPELLRRVFLELADQAAVCNGPKAPAGLPPALRVVAADATVWKTLPKMCRELFDAPLNRARKGELTGHLQFDVLDQVPCDASFVLASGGERQALRQKLLPNTLYLLDRGYVDYTLYRQVMDAQASFVGRLNDTAQYSVLSARPLAAEAKGAGVIEDLAVELGAERVPLRLIRVRTVLPPPHNLHPVRKNGKHKAYAKGEAREVELLLATDRTDLSVEVIVQLYRLRWQVELFFRWFKCVLGCKRLMAQTENGLNLQMYAALIASLLVVVWTGRKPTTMILNILHYFLMGWASGEELMAVVLKQKPAGTT